MGGPPAEQELFGCRYRSSKTCDGVDESTIDIAICCSYAAAESLAINQSCCLLCLAVHRCTEVGPILAQIKLDA